MMHDELSTSARTANDEQPYLVTRFSIVILAFTLIGMGIGSALPSGCSAVTIGAGFVGILGYAIFERTARQQYCDAVKVVRAKAENRLVRHIQSAEHDDVRVEPI